MAGSDGSLGALNGQLSTIRGVEFDARAGILSRGLRQRRISPTEARLLEMFLAHPGVILSRERLRDAVWNTYDARVQLRTVDVHVGRLRQAFRRLDERRVIITVRGDGYMLQTS